MAAPPLTNALAAEAVRAVRQYGSQAAAARALGISESTLKSRYKLAQKRADSAAGSDTVSVNGDACEVTKTTAQRVRTLADLVRVCEIDTTEWTVDRWICNKWDAATKIGQDANERIAVTELYQVKVWLTRKAAVVDARAEIAALLDDAKKQAPKRPAVKRSGKAHGVMLEVSIPDLHVGKLAWAKETGAENYDSKIAEAIFDDALTALIERTASYTFDRVLFVVGNDLLHSDNKAGTTTAGTPLDTDSRYHKSFGLVRRMITRAIERLRRLAPVQVLMVPGNHDTLAVWHLGDSLECLFHGDPDVMVDNAPTMRKYHQFGKVMLLFTHGNRGKLADYPLLMATEQPKMFGETIHREAHTGDKHQLKVQEHHGVRVRISPALCAADAWHAEHHFVGNARAAEAFIWHAEEGLIGTAVYTVPPMAQDGAA
jgi:hypothetical protein